jgi:hypothetical protein
MNKRIKHKRKKMLFYSRYAKYPKFCEYAVSDPLFKRYPDYTFLVGIVSGYLYKNKQAKESGWTIDAVTLCGNYTNLLIQLAYMERL